MQQFEDYERDNKHNIIYQIVEHFDTVQDILYYPRDVYRTASWIFRNRYIRKTWMMGSSLDKNTTHDFNVRLLHSTFDTLVDYLRIIGKKSKRLRFTSNDDDGINLLCSELMNEYNEDAKAQWKKLISLYLWWTKVRPMNEKLAFKFYENNQTTYTHEYELIERLDAIDRQKLKELIDNSVVLKYM